MHLPLRPSHLGGPGGIFCDEPDPWCAFRRVLKREGEGDEQGGVPEEQDEGADGRWHEGLPRLAGPCWGDRPWQLQVSRRHFLNKTEEKWQTHTLLLFETKFSWKSSVCHLFLLPPLYVGSQTGGIEALPKIGNIYICQHLFSDPQSTKSLPQRFPDSLFNQNLWSIHEQVHFV